MAWNPFDDGVLGSEGGQQLGRYVGGLYTGLVAGGIPPEHALEMARAWLHQVVAMAHSKPGLRREE